MPRDYKFKTWSRRGQPDKYLVDNDEGRYCCSAICPKRGIRIDITTMIKGNDKGLEMFFCSKECQKEFEGNNL